MNENDFENGKIFYFSIANLFMVRMFIQIKRFRILFGIKNKYQLEIAALLSFGNFQSYHARNIAPVTLTNDLRSFLHTNRHLLYLYKS